jgi:hypothetical protein
MYIIFFIIPVLIGTVFRAYQDEHKKHFIWLLKQEGFRFNIFTLTVKGVENVLKSYNGDAQKYEELKNELDIMKTNQRIGFKIFLFTLLVLTAIIFCLVKFG